MLQISTRRPTMSSVASPDDIVFTKEEVEEFKKTFNEFDADGNGHITVEELDAVFKKVGENVPGYKRREMVDEVDKDKNGTIEWEEFLFMMKKVRSEGGNYVGTLHRMIKKVENVKKLGGTSANSTAGTTHSFADDEVISFSEHINSELGKDPESKGRLPIKIENHKALFEALKDGVLLCKLINKSVPNTIDERVINVGKLDLYRMTENQTLALNSAAAIGCNTVNMGPNDIIQGTEHIVLGLLWQVIRIGLFAGLNLNLRPELYALEGFDDGFGDLASLAPDALLLRWVNYHLKNAGTEKRIKNFGSDIKDSEAYIYLLKQIAPSQFGLNLTALSYDPARRAEAVLDDAEKLGARKFVRPEDILKGNPKLNLAFVANLFNMYPGLGPSRGEGQELGVPETREEKTFRNWMNSLGVNPYVNYFYNDLSDGIVILQLLDRVHPGIVEWPKVTMPPFKKIGAQMKKIENNNYAIELGKKLNFSLVGIQGKDILDGIKVLVLGFIWQIMRAYTLVILTKISGSSKPVAEAEIIDWVNKTLVAAKSKCNPISGFKDDSIKTSMPILDIINFIAKGSVNYTIVKAGVDEEEKMNNAKYAISLARKIGAGVYALPDDIVEGNPKMVLTIFACLMARSYKK